MATTLNGWPAVPTVSDPRLAVGKVPGTSKKIRLHRAALPLFLSFLHDVDQAVIDLDAGPLDGWSYRVARAATGLSNHASGTAADFRYDVLKADHQVHLNTKQRATMRHLLDVYTTSRGKRVFGWGGDWKLMDEMHLEIGQPWQPKVGSPVTTRDVNAVIARLGIKPDGTRTQH